MGRSARLTLEVTVLAGQIFDQFVLFTDVLDSFEGHEALVQS